MKCVSYTFQLLTELKSKISVSSTFNNTNTLSLLLEQISFSGPKTDLSYVGVYVCTLRLHFH